METKLHAGLLHHALDTIQRIHRRLTSQSSEPQLLRERKELTRLLFRLAEIRDVGVDGLDPDRIQFGFERRDVCVRQMLVERHVRMFWTQFLPEEQLDHIGAARLRFFDRLEGCHLTKRIRTHADFHLRGQNRTGHHRNGRSYNSLFRHLFSLLRSYR